MILELCKKKLLDSCHLHLCFRNLSQNLSFLIPVITDSTFKKCQLFCTTRYATDIISSWLIDELAKVQRIKTHSILVEKLTGDNTRSEKERVMKLFKEGVCQVLVCTDVAGMGLHVSGLNLAVNIGVPKTPWKLQQQIGRIGRDGEKSLCVTLVFPQKGKQAPDLVLRNIMKGNECLRKSLNDLFVLSDPFIDYTKQPIVNGCSDECVKQQTCHCSACQCCSVCNASCECLYSIQDSKVKMEEVLGCGGESYREVERFMLDNASDVSDGSEFLDDFEEDITFL